MLPGTQLPGGVPPTVLVLDTDVDAARALHQQLLSAGFPGCVATSREDAIEILQHIRFDVMVVRLELDLPGDLEFLGELRHQAPPTWIIAASALCDQSARRRVFMNGGDGLVQAPIRELGELIFLLEAFSLHSRPI